MVKELRPNLHTLFPQVRPALSIVHKEMGNLIHDSETSEMFDQPSTGNEESLGILGNMGIFRKLGLFRSAPI
jgi:hypothetical protein